VPDGPLTILAAAPAYWPATAFGGPIPVMRELARRLTERGHRLDVVTTSILDLHRRPAFRSRADEVDGAHVHYLGTPLAYRWMGVAPSLPLELRRLPRPDVVHLYGFRDPLTTGTALWCRARGIPYVLEPLGMFRPRLRKVRLKEGFDRGLGRPLAARAETVVTASERERDDVVAFGLDPERVVVRGNGFPEAPAGLDGSAAREQLGVPEGAPLALYVGRIADGKGIEHLVEAARRAPEAHVVIAGPDDRHRATARLREAEREPGLAGRLHVLPASDGPPWELYAAADAFVLASAGESFGMAAAEAAAAGAAVVVSNQCGVAGSFEEGEALVVPYEADAIVTGVANVLTDAGLRERLRRGAGEAARRNAWERIADRQEAIYRAAAARTAATKFSMLGS
jgi:glycosyltransferase involved in cell wall biosynthesis